jgi:Zn-dependent protease with chaperone function
MRRLTWQGSILGSEQDFLAVDLFDGRSALPRRVHLSLSEGQARLTSTDTDQVLLQYDARQVQWPERTRHGARIAQLPDGGSLHALTPSEWDAWMVRHGHRSSAVVHAQLSWRATLAALVVLMAGLWGAYEWGLPLAAQGVLALTPRSVDQKVGEVAIDSLEGQWFKPSELPPATQARLTEAFDSAAQKARLPHSATQHVSHVPYKIVFRRSRIGPNALAFPDGTIVITDELVKLLEGQDQVLVGVFAHEWGHVRERHSMRLLIQASALGAITSLVIGDFSSVLAGAPAVLGHLGYSRDLEREADDTCIEVLRANDISPTVMVTLFEKLAQAQKERDKDSHSSSDSGPGVAYSSHPSDAERIARFQRGH